MIAVLNILGGLSLGLLLCGTVRLAIVFAAYRRNRQGVRV